MSFSDVFHDYIQDVPMDVGRKFFPAPNISIDNIFVPKSLVFSEIQYNFDAEYRAREEFDNQGVSTATSIDIPKVVEVEKPKIPAHLELSQEVLQPCPVSASIPKSVTKFEIATNFGEFETQTSVFDDVELLALDEKKVLQEVLMSSSSSSSLAQPTSSVNNNLEKTNSLPKFETKEDEKMGELKRKLLAKGYRTDVVNICFSKVPKNRFTHIEYYMKACRTIEKSKQATIDDAIDFLIKCNLTDKQIILNYSESCAEILKMLYPKDLVFDAVYSNNGDRTAALNSLLKN